MSSSGPSRNKKGRCCPVIDGSRERRLLGLSLMAEICVVLVALFVLQEVRSNVIPWGCTWDQKQTCLRLWQPEPSFLPGSCDEARATCFNAVGSSPASTTVTDAGFPLSYNATFGYCQCLVYSQMQANGLPYPGRCVFSNIFSILIFVLGSALLLVTELLLKRKVTAWIVWGSCELYFVASFIIVQSLGWGGLCQGIQYDNMVSILAALIIGQCIFFLAAFVVMMLGAAKLAPSGWILYDVEQYTEAKQEVKLKRRQTARIALTESGRHILVQNSNVPPAPGAQDLDEP